MKTLLIGLYLAGFVLLGSLSASADDALKPFQGLWAVVSITRDGQEQPQDQAQRLVLTVKGSERKIMDGEDVRAEAKFSIDATKTPKEMDIVVSTGPLAGKTLKGIYELDGDTLKINMPLEGDKRPTDMTANEGSKRLLQVFERSQSKAAAKYKNPELRTLLLARRMADQGGRLRLMAIMREHQGKLSDEAKTVYEAIAAEVQETDVKNREWLDGVIKKDGWPTISAVGEEAAQAAFLIAQHADGNRKFQKRCLELMKASVAAKEAAPEFLAYLTDRVRVASGEKQVYGTEVEVKDGKLAPHPIEDEANVDKRRKEAGLPTLAEALKQAREQHGLPEKP
ncbi:MAG: TIGR03067 domain-containing protein [Fimbriiglobus sp.]